MFTAILLLDRLDLLTNARPKNEKRPIIADIAHVGRAVLDLNGQLSLSKLQSYSRPPYTPNAVCKWMKANMMAALRQLYGNCEGM